MIHSLHGAVGSYRDWSQFAENICHSQTQHKAHDLWSYFQHGACDLWEFASIFNDSVEAHHSDQAQDLIGYSMGGRLALHALLERPSLWRSAVIVSAHTGLDQCDTEGRSARLESDLAWASLAADESQPWQTFLESWNDQGVLKVTENSPTLDWYDRSLLGSHRQEISESFHSWSLAHQDDLLARLHEVNIPVLWIVGERDQKFVNVAKLAVAALPNAELLTIPEVGHRVPWEAPSRFDRAIASWLDLLNQEQ